MLIKGVVIFFLIFQEASSNSFLKIKNILEFINLWTSTLDSITIYINALGPEDTMPQEILSSVHAVSERLDEIGIHLDQKLDVFAINLPNQVRAFTRIDRDIDEIVKNMRDVNYLYKTYYTNLLNTTVSNYTLQSFITTATSVGNDSPRKMVENIYSYFYTGELNLIKDSLLYTIVKTLESQAQTRCDEFQSPQHWLYEVYSLITVVEIRALIMVTTAFKMRSNSTGENHEMDIKLTKDQYLDRMKNYLTIMREAFGRMPADVRRCDPKSQTRGETFLELERFAQTVIINSDQLSSGETCQECETFKNHHYTTFRRTAWGNRIGTCNGVLTTCTTWQSKLYRFPASHRVEICKLPEGSTRRYDYFVDSEGHVSGDKSSCSGTIRNDMPCHFCPLSIDDRLVIPARCSNSQCNHCLCTCIEDGSTSTSIRKFDLEKQNSNCPENMVVIGVRMLLDNKVIRIQIKEGKLMAGGRILPGSEKWIPLRPIDNNNVISLQGENVIRKSVLLDDVVTPEGPYVITGIHFTVTGRDKQSIAINFQAREFDFTTGLLDCSSSQTPLKRDKIDRDVILNIKNAKHPLKSQLNLPDSVSGQLVEFQPSSIEMDAGQTVVPFLDIQPVYTKPSAPLSGIGFYHKGAPGFGGFVALKIYTLNIKNFIDTKINDTK